MAEALDETPADVDAGRAPLHSCELAELAAGLIDTRCRVEACGALRQAISLLIGPTAKALPSSAATWRGQADGGQALDRLESR